MNITLYEKKRSFANVIKNLKMKSSWIIPVGPKSNDKYPYKRHRVEKDREEEKAM